MDIGSVRKDFQSHRPLKRSDLSDSPWQQFENWFGEAMQAKLEEPNAFVLATVNTDGQSSQRTVLLKFFDTAGFVFYTNYHSRKAQEIAQNQKVSMLFPWYGLQRQVKVEGYAEKVSREQSLKYFLSRPVGSQIGAWASPQSKVIDTRDFLRLQWQKMQNKFRNGEIPLPDFWGGYRIIPMAFEFWQGQPNRLHDRFVYLRDNDNWNIQRLAP
ncbi:pyridoxamine 5'-phosphate oxidase [Suttonella ornithocola]|uniref:Pyridoxine/pyridoxamine 5'-phosphate oxidase n=1 Tax=Suttonella ornithocola TaxID=279832 RepID=A0A380MMV4_9GAMM|nr:pyridoxamine 5'-phosphate oxidase [Suttonella ornithocola]SUO93071.1 Pyridoxine/pyridoxamine 5'-phosphate oxidase [Suttonella ornithocola]